MAQTVIGIFKNSTEAQNAKQHLLKNGFRDDRIDIARQSSTNMTHGDEHGRQDDDFGDKVSRFFSNLFGNEEESTKYSRAATMGTVVTVHAADSEEAEVAADILDDYGAVDVDEYAAGTVDTQGRTSTTTSESDRLGGMNSGRASVLDSGDITDSRRTDMNQDLTDRDRNINRYDTDSDLTNRETDRDLADRNMGTVRSEDRDTDMDFDETRRSMDTNRTGDRDETKFPIIEENLDVSKKEVQTGGTRVRSRIVERPVEETVRLREEHVNVERNPVDRPASEQDLTNFKEGTVEFTETAEVPVVNKEARVVEEVNVFKDVDEKQETVREVLRNTEVETDDLKARNEADDHTRHDDDHLENRDDVHRQRPGII